MKGPSRHVVPAEIQKFCERMINDKVYRTNIQIRLHEGTLPPAMETMIWYYAAGKPPETLDVTVDEGSSDWRSMSKDQLAARLESLRKEALECQEEDENNVLSFPKPN